MDVEEAFGQAATRKRLVQLLPEHIKRLFQLSSDSDQLSVDRATLLYFYELQDHIKVQEKELSAAAEKHQAEKVEVVQKLKEVT